MFSEIFKYTYKRIYSHSWYFWITHYLLLVKNVCFSNENPIFIVNYLVNNFFENVDVP